MPGSNAADEDWDLLLSFFPSDWMTLARRSGALKGLRQDKSAENLLRVLLLHLGCGYSMRETVVRAKEANLADLSDVALLKRLRKSKDWLYQLCCGLFAERGFQSAASGQPMLRLVDSTVVQEPGKTGALWRIHYSFHWPTLVCDYFEVTGCKGTGTGETLRHYPIRAGEYVLADRGYCKASGIHFAVSKGAYLTVRLSPQSIRLQGQYPLAARLCVLRKSEAAIALAQKKARRKSRKNGQQLQSETLFYAQFVMVLSTFPEEDFTSAQVLQCYRYRWQIELVFKRFKQIAQLGHLPKYHDESAKAWLYGKLFVALLTEKLIQHARAVSPWGYELQVQTSSQSMA